VQNVVTQLGETTAYAERPRLQERSANFRIFFLAAALGGVLDGTQSDAVYACQAKGATTGVKRGRVTCIAEDIASLSTTRIILT
jgi:hypothetical protein